MKGENFCEVLILVRSTTKVRYVVNVKVLTVKGEGFCEHGYW